MTLVFRVHPTLLGVCSFLFLLYLLYVLSSQATGWSLSHRLPLRRCFVGTQTSGFGLGTCILWPCLPMYFAIFVDVLNLIPKYQSLQLEVRKHVCQRFMMSKQQHGKEEWKTLGVDGRYHISPITKGFTVKAL